MMFKVAVSVLALYYVIFSFTAVQAVELLHRTSECTCLSQNVTYQCTVCGPGGKFTVWRFPNTSEQCEIIIRHADFMSRYSINDCDNITAVGQGLSIENDCYTSELTVLVRTPIITIQCAFDDGDINRAIDSSELILSSEPLSPPSNISLTNITKESDTVNMTFNWQPPLHNCPTIGYSISPSNCGGCTNINTTSASPTVSCKDVNLPTNCTVTVESHTCADFSIQGRNTSKPLFINLDVPSSPIIDNICAYSSENGSYILCSTFFQVEPVTISDGISASATSYTITYSDSISKAICYESTIPASTCQNQICSHDAVFNFTLSSCARDTNISVTIYATNMLGDGGISTPVNQFISCSDMMRATPSEDSNTATITIATTVPMSILTIVAIISVVAIVWIGLKRKFNRDEPDIVHEFKIRTTSDPIKHFKIYNVKEKCQLRKFITRTIGESISQLKNGFVYYRWEEAEEYIRSEREVIVYRKIGSKEEVFLCQRDKYNKLRKFHRPDLTETTWTAIFVQCKSENRELPQDTQVLYRISPALCKIKKKKCTVLDVDSEIKMVEFGRNNIPSYNHTDGFGYHEFTSDQYISSDKKILLMNKNGDVFTGPGVHCIVHIGPDVVHPPDLSQTEWECAFVQSDSADRKLEPGTRFLYCTEYHLECSCDQ